MSWYWIQQQVAKVAYRPGRGIAGFTMQKIGNAAAHHRHRIRRR